MISGVEEESFKNKGSSIDLLFPLVGDLNDDSEEDSEGVVYLLLRGNDFQETFIVAIIRRLI